MAISRDLFSAILAMDSYNRGYNAGIGDLGGVGSQLGLATVSTDSSLVFNGSDEDISFYAAAYDVSNVSGFSAGEKVISYRGTDDAVGDYFFDGDIWNGWSGGAGDATTAQSELAFEFYQSVAGPESNWQSANISLTGHSLGGGLAGLVGSVYGQSATIFDNMAFELAADASYAESLVDPALRSLIYGSSTPWEGGDSKCASCTQHMGAMTAAFSRCK